MVYDAYTKKDEEDLDRPFTFNEKRNILVTCLIGYPIGLAIVLLPGAWIRTFPHFPPLWYGFWVVEITVPIVMLVVVSFLLDSPRLIRIRTRKLAAGKDESLAEQRFHKIASFIFIMGILITTYDASGNCNYPVRWNWIGVTTMTVSSAGILWVFRVNQYAARVVYVQPKQRLITNGPYAWVRHPMYLAIIPCYCALPIALGSFWGVLPMIVCQLTMVIRITHEERFLVDTFGKDYQDYQRRVPYRLLPLVY